MGSGWVGPLASALMWSILWKTLVREFLTIILDRWDGLGLAHQQDMNSTNPLSTVMRPVLGAESLIFPAEKFWRDVKSIVPSST
eukprot:scaffold26329_cov47-Attheya_sp.AAC.3